MKNKAKVALIGVGRWGKVLLGELKKQAEVKYECDRKTDLAQVFADREVEAVFIATPTETHFNIAFKALEAGKHVFLEKPGTTSSVELEKLVKLSEAKKLVLAVGYEFPHHPAAKKLKELIAGKKTRSIYFHWQKWGTFDYDAVIHLLCHDVSVLKFLGIEPRLVSCRKTAVISDSDILETEFRGNIKSFINRVSPVKEKSVTVMTENGEYVWNGDELFEIDRVSKQLVPIEEDKTTPVAAEITDFLDAIRHKRSPMINGQFALEVYRIIESAKF